MNSKLSTVLVAISLIALAGACGGRRGGRDAAVTPQNSFLRARAAQTVAATHCDCFAPLGYASTSECEDDTAPDSLNATQIGCVDSIYVSWADSLNPRFLCIEEANQNYHTCMLAVTACDSAAVTSCVTTLSSMVQACPTLDPSLQNSISTCLAPPP